MEIPQTFWLISESFAWKNLNCAHNCSQICNLLESLVIHENAKLTPHKKKFSNLAHVKTTIGIGKEWKCSRDACRLSCDKSTAFSMEICAWKVEALIDSCCVELFTARVAVTTNYSSRAMCLLIVDDNDLLCVCALKLSLAEPCLRLLPNFSRKFLVNVSN